MHFVFGLVGSVSCRYEQVAFHLVLVHSPFYNMVRDFIFWKIEEFIMGRVSL